MQQKHYDIWNTVKDLCVFVNNQRAFTIKELRAKTCVTWSCRLEASFAVWEDHFKPSTSSCRRLLAPLPPLLFLVDVFHNRINSRKHISIFRFNFSKIADDGTTAVVFRGRGGGAGVSCQVQSTGIKSSVFNQNFWAASLMPDPRGLATI